MQLALLLLAMVGIIPGFGVKTGVINSWSQSDGVKCSDVGLWYRLHMWYCQTLFLKTQDGICGTVWYCRRVFLQITNGGF